MKNWKKRRHIYAIILGIVLITLLLPAFSNAQLPFGGMVTFTRVCDTGLLVTVLQPLSGVQEFMWLTGELPYNWHVAPHISQELLGVYIPGSLTCLVGNVSYGSGPIIMFHGSSY